MKAFESPITLGLLVWALLFTGFAGGQRTYIDYLQNEVNSLQSTVIHGEFLLSQMQQAFKKQEVSDGREAFITKYIQSRNHSIGVSTATLLSKTFIEVGDEYNFDPLFLAAQASVESAFKVHDKSTAGAIGIMQVMPFWVEKIDFLEHKDDLFNIHANIRAGVFILAHYRDTCGGSLRQALTCYHGGPRALKLPRRVTTEYVSSVLARWKTLELM